MKPIEPNKQLIFICRVKPEVNCEDKRVFDALKILDDEGEVIKWIITPKCGEDIPVPFNIGAILGSPTYIVSDDYFTKNFELILKCL